MILQRRQIESLQQAYAADMVWAILGNVYAIGNGKQFSAKSYTDFSQSIEKIVSEPAKSNQEMAEDVVGMFDKYGEKGGSEDETI